MELLMDPSIWAGLLTLIVLEIVLGIDNLVFIAILADKLPPKQRDKARLIGLSLALVMRLGLLSVISWMVTLTKPLITIADFSFSGRDLIMLLGGIFLLFKATTELHERLEKLTLPCAPKEALRISVGVAPWGPQFGHYREWLKAADVALYRAKNAGRGRTEVAA